MRTPLSYHTSGTTAMSIREEDLDTAGVECVTRPSEMRFVTLVATPIIMCLLAVGGNEIDLFIVRIVTGRHWSFLVGANV
jgi:hypothetical protein